MNRIAENLLTDYILASLIAFASRKDQAVGNVVEIRLLISETIIDLSPELVESLQDRFEVNAKGINLFSSNNRSNSEKEKLLSNLLLFFRNGNLDTFIGAKLLESYVVATKSTEIIEVKEEERIDTTNFFDRDQDWNTRGDFYEEDQAYISQYIGYGTRNKHLLNLSKVEEKFLNQLSVGDTVFTEIEQCALETAKLFLKLLQSIESFYNSNGKDFYPKLEALDLQYRKIHYSYYSTDQSWMWKPSNGILKALLKFAENCVRFTYRHTRKREEDGLISDIQEHFSEIDIDFIQNKIKLYAQEVASPTTETLVALNAMNRARWKDSFKAIKKMAATNTEKEQIQQIASLIKLNAKNPSLPAIFFEAAKLLASSNKLLGIQYYFQYCMGVIVQKKEPKELPKSMEKKLFSNVEQRKKFYDLKMELTKPKSLVTVLKKIPDIFKKERKTVVLNAGTIAGVNERYSETVNKLGEALKEEYDEMMEEEVKTQKLESVVKVEKAIGLNDIFGTGDEEAPIEFDEVQLGLIKLFLDNENELDAEAIGIFAKSQGRFTNQLLNSINESFMEVKEDLLIEETEDGGTINLEYLEEIKRLVYVD